MRWHISKGGKGRIHTTLIAHSLRHLQEHYGKAYAGHNVFTARGRLVGRFDAEGNFLEIA